MYVDRYFLEARAQQTVENVIITNCGIRSFRAFRSLSAIQNLVKCSDAFAAYEVPVIVQTRKRIHRTSIPIYFVRELISIVVSVRNCTIRNVHFRFGRLSSRNGTRGSRNVKIESVAIRRHFRASSPRTNLRIIIGNVYTMDRQYSESIRIYVFTILH